MNVTLGVRELAHAFSRLRRAAGTHLNAAMRVDPVLKNTSLADPVGASVAFYDTNIKLISTLTN